METKKYDYEKMWKELKTYLRSSISLFKRLAKEDLRLTGNAFNAKDRLESACVYERMLVLMKAEEKQAIVVPSNEDDGDYNPTPIEDMEFTARTYDCLERAGKYRVGDLLKMSYADLLKIRNLGRRSADEVREKLKAVGLELRED